MLGIGHWRIGALAHWVGEEAAGLSGGGVELQRGERAVQLAVVQLARAVAVEAHERGEHVGIDGGGGGGSVVAAKVVGAARGRSRPEGWWPGLWRLREVAGWHQTHQLAAPPQEPAWRARLAEQLDRVACFEGELVLFLGQEGGRGSTERRRRGLRVLHGKRRASSEERPRARQATSALGRFGY